MYVWKHQSSENKGTNITVILFQQLDKRHYKVWENTNISSFTDAMRQLVMIHVLGVLLKRKENRIVGISSQDTKSWKTHLQVNEKWFKRSNIYNRSTTLEGRLVDPQGITRYIAQNQREPLIQQTLFWANCFGYMIDCCTISDIHFPWKYITEDGY